MLKRMSSDSFDSFPYSPATGIDLVAMWLDGDKKVFNVESRDGIEQTQTTMSGKPALTHDPLVVL
eukprot:scaffold126984_cov21-Tisochrysis_lutea.AAC.3